MTLIKRSTTIIVKIVRWFTRTKEHKGLQSPHVCRILREKGSSQFPPSKLEKTNKCEVWTTSFELWTNNKSLESEKWCIYEKEFIIGKAKWGKNKISYFSDFDLLCCSLMSCFFDLILLLIMFLFDQIFIMFINIDQIFIMSIYIDQIFTILLRLKCFFFVYWVWFVLL